MLCHCELRFFFCYLMCDCLVFYVVILDNFVVVEFYGIDMFFFFEGYLHGFKF